jgi:Domain of unknown function (DUF4396)
MPVWLTVIAWLSLALGFVTAAIIAADEIAHPQRMPIMNIVWPVTGLYFPLLGLWFYRQMGRPMAVDAGSMGVEHRFWKSIFVSSTHCGSGCVIGDIIGAPIVFATGFALFGERLFAEYVVEFAIAYILGIAFQYIPIRSMRKVSPHEAIVDAMKADTLSLVAFELGMFGWMAVVYFLFMPEPRPGAASVVFWFVMQIGMVLGFLTTYPANWLLVKWGVKSGM